MRYVAAFGPATVQDAQAWSGLTKLGEVFDRLAPRLVTFRDEDGRTLHDLPDAPRPPADVDAPPRFLPDFDNLLLSHADRNHVIVDEHRSVFMANNFVIGTVLIDGWVGATWKVARSKTQGDDGGGPVGALRQGDARRRHRGRRATPEGARCGFG